MKIHRIIAGLVAALVTASCSPPPPPTPYVASACPLPGGVHGYPVTAHNPAGRFETAMLSRIARAVSVSLAISHQHGDSLPDDLARLAVSLAPKELLSRLDWRPSPTDTASILITYRGGRAAPDIRLAPGDSDSGAFPRRVLHSATVARERAQLGRIQLDTLPLQFRLADDDSAVVLVHFGSEPGPNDGVAHFAAQERDVEALRGNRAPQYPPTLLSDGVAGDVVVAFVLRPDSAPDMSTARVLRSPHPYFTQSVLEALAHHKYVPLELDCRVYPVLVQEPFRFRLR